MYRLPMALNVYFPNADEVRDFIPESVLPDDALEWFWQEAQRGRLSGYFIPKEIFPTS